MPYFACSAEFIVEHILAASGDLHSLPVVCVFPEAGDAVRELDVAYLLRDRGINVITVWLMDMVVSVPDDGSLNVRVFTSYHDLNVALKKIRDVSVLVPGIQQMHYMRGAKDGAQQCLYFAICEVLHRQKIICHTYINYVSYGPWQNPVNKKFDWIHTESIGDNAVVYHASWLDRCQASLRQLTTWYPEFKVAPICWEVSELLATGINDQHVLFEGANDDNFVRGSS